MPGTCSQLSSESDSKLCGAMFLTPSDAHARGPVQGVLIAAWPDLVGRLVNVKLSVSA